jgi:hypothetical protein
MNRAARACCAAALLAADPSSAAPWNGSAVPDPYSFTLSVARRLNATHPVQPAQITAPLMLQIGISEQINLSGLYMACRAQPPACGGNVDRFVASASGALAPPQSSAPLKSAALRVIIRPRLELLNDPQGEGAAVAASINGIPADLSVLLVAETAASLRPVSPAELAVLGLAPEQAYAIALRNVAETLLPAERAFPRLPPRGIGVVADSPYEASRLLRPEDWPAIATRFGNALLLATPASGMVLYEDGSQPLAVAALAAVARDQFSHADRPLSPQVLRWAPDGWTIAAP